MSGEETKVRSGLEAKAEEAKSTAHSSPPLGLPATRTVVNFVWGTQCAPEGRVITAFILAARRLSPRVHGEQIMHVIDMAPQRAAHTCSHKAGGTCDLSDNGKS